MPMTHGAPTTVPQQAAMSAAAIVAVAPPHDPGVGPLLDDPWAAAFEAASVATAAPIFTGWPSTAAIAETPKQEELHRRLQVMQVKLDHMAELQQQSVGQQQQPSQSSGSQQQDAAPVGQDLHEAGVYGLLIDIEIREYLPSS